MEPEGVTEGVRSPPVAVLPRHARATLILGRVGVGFLAWMVMSGLLLGMTSGMGTDPMLGAVPIVLAASFVVTSVWRHWNDRVEVFTDQITKWHGGRPTEFPMESVDHVRLDVSAVDQGMAPYNPATVRLIAADGRTMTLPERPLRELYTVLDTVSRPVMDRTFAAMARGETVDFSDTPRFPVGSTVGVISVLAVFLLMLLPAVVGMGPYPSDRTVGFVLLVEALAIPGPVAALVYAKILRPGLRRWREARRAGGVAVSASGVRPYRDKTLAALATRHGDPFRSPSGEAGGWIPWSTVRLAQLTGHGIVMHLDSRPEPVLLSSATHNLIPLWNVVRHQCPAPAPAPMQPASNTVSVPAAVEESTGVRIDAAVDMVDMPTAPAVAGEAPLDDTIAASPASTRRTSRR